ncbi:hydrogenase expression/formation protein HypD [Candidatus Omnitrophus magneticus]|uniref:Hydrogenase expression/formation protein HypD n=1 Tax=Candidatus Omnitrophus magneticus TaxID=1609969 RepID=A0A0F0CSN4_9BACT|nr:hydrogenase expression/formation protein HypD [Candidatus Omnitrophus magneticus]
MLKFIDEYRDREACLDTARKIREISTKPFNIMEVCGGHTMAIRKNGIHKIIGDKIRLISGPGCPVCVTSIQDIDKAVFLAGIKGVSVCTFGDLMYVPGSYSSLASVRSEGGDVRVVYSVMDVLDFCKKEPDKKFIFIGIGFETTVPTIAASIVSAEEEKIENFFVLALNKTLPSALSVVLNSEDSKIDALIAPGHVSAITGFEMYRFIVDEIGVLCCVAGFEPLDILKAIYILAKAHSAGEMKLFNGYERIVTANGNEKAKKIIAKVFEPCSSEWRGCGFIPDSGLRIRREYRTFDAEKIIDIKVPVSSENPGCICGSILRGANTPMDCVLFKKVCTPSSPKGACMVSSEGTCAAWFKYET